MADSNLGPIVGVILAGGQAQRMGGGDKSLYKVGGAPILARVIERMRPQVGALVLNANGDPARFASFGLPVEPDPLPDFAGPLAGILAGMDWAAEHQAPARCIVSAPGDGPFLPRDLVQRLAAALASEDAEIAMAASGRQRYPVVGLWPLALRDNLQRALLEENLHKIDAWTARFRLAVADFPATPIDPFFNANTPEQLAEAERLAALHPAV